MGLLVILSSTRDGGWHEHPDGMLRSPGTPKMRGRRQRDLTTAKLSPRGPHPDFSSEPPQGKGQTPGLEQILMRLC